MKKIITFTIALCFLFVDINAQIKAPRLLSFSRPELISLKHTTRCVMTIHRLFGDSIIKKAMKTKRWYDIRIRTNFNDTVTDIKIMHGGRKDNGTGEDIAKFLDDHKYEIVSNYISTYGYIYEYYVKGDYLHNFEERVKYLNYDILCFTFPYTCFDIDIIMEDTVDGFLEKIAKYEYCPIKTSIDEGIMPESYFWYIKEFQKIYGIENQSY